MNSDGCQLRELRPDSPPTDAASLGDGWGGLRILLLGALERQHPLGHNGCASLLIGLITHLFWRAEPSGTISGAGDAAVPEAPGAIGRSRPAAAIQSLGEYEPNSRQ